MGTDATDDSAPVAAATAASAVPAVVAAALLSAGDSQALLSVLVAAMAVRRRLEFFAWTQGHLQALLPHAVLVCGRPRAAGTAMFFDYFHKLSLSTAVFSRLCHPRDGLVLRLLDAWRAQGSDPILVHDGQGRNAALYAQLQELGLGATLAHGIPLERSQAGAHGFFAFVSLRSPPGTRETALASLIVPAAFGAYCRALAGDHLRSVVPRSHSEGMLTEREIEILHWVREGKSNPEIATLLTLSPLTVKNHIQRILRKLNASNRTQAVSKALNLGVLSSTAAAIDPAPPPPA